MAKASGWVTLIVEFDAKVFSYQIIKDEIRKAGLTKRSQGQPRMAKGRWKISFRLPSDQAEDAKTHLKRLDGVTVHPV